MSKKRIITITMLVGLTAIFTTSIMAYGDIENVPSSVRNMLEYDTVVTDIFRSIGYWIYGLLAFFTDMCEEGFYMLANYDIMSLDVVSEVKANLDIVLYSVLFMGFIMVVVIRMFKLENQFKTLFDVVLTLMFIAMFVGVLGIMTNIKTALINEVNGVVAKSENETMAETLYKTDTIDLLKSIKANNLIYLKDIEGLNLDYHDSTIRIKKADLNEKIIGVNPDGTYEIEKLQDGIFGTGDVRYYRYRTDYFALNITLGVSVIIYALAIFKMCYLLYQWLQINILGTFAMGQGFMDFKKVSGTYKSALITLVGEVILYFSMMLFSVLSNSIMLDGALKGNWLLQAIFIFAIGMAVITGTGFINDKLGIDDGSQFALKSIFMANRISRLATAPLRAGKKVIDKANDVIKDGNDKRNENSSHKNDGFNNTNKSDYKNNESENSSHKASMDNLNKSKSQMNENENGEQTSKYKNDDLDKKDNSVKKDDEPSWKKTLEKVNQDDKAKTHENDDDTSNKKDDEPSWKKGYEDNHNSMKGQSLQKDDETSNKKDDEPSWKKGYEDNHNSMKGQSLQKDDSTSFKKDNETPKWKKEYEDKAVEYTGIKNQRNQSRMNKVNEKRTDMSTRKSKNNEIETEYFNTRNKSSSDELYEEDNNERKQRRGVKNVNNTKEK